jgi:NodT family efflux transporter outer membrane factor (OMF) lipoprotein
MAGAALPETFTSNNFTASIAAAYEVDLWKKVGNRAAGATVDSLAFRDDVETVAITLVSEVAEAWFDLVLQRAQKKLLTEQLEINETFLELINLRFKQGLASALDIYQQQQLLASRRAQLATIDAAISVLTNRLAVLAGQAPGEVKVAGGDALPSLPAVPGVGLPADLLNRRPDVRAARRRVEAADHRVAAAVADRLPGLRLQGSLSLQNGDIAELIARPLYSILAAITAPLFDGGRRSAEVDRNRAVVEELLANYGQKLLVAMTEVENSLVQEKHQALRIWELEIEAEVAAKALVEARTRYQQGLSDFLPVLTALQGEQRTQLNLLQARRQLISFRIQLLRALGGTWTKELEAPKPVSPKSEEKQQ